MRPTTYLPTPADAPVVTITDYVTGEVWHGVDVDGIVHDASGIVDPDDIGVRFAVERDGNGATVEPVLTPMPAGCPARHAGPCDATLAVSTVVSTLEVHGVRARVGADAGTVEAWEEATVFPLDGSPARDASGWVTVPRDVHALAAWLGY
jgi:hypothetical protein